MTDFTPADGRPDASMPLLDGLLRETLPEIKLALGAWIDGENTRALPGRYAKLLPETLLLVALRPDAAAALTPVAREVERELTDSCTRHGSLYDRIYRVQLRRAEDEDAPLFTVSAQAGHALPAEAPAVAAPRPAQASEDATVAAAPTLPPADPDATRIDGLAPSDWDPGRWVLVVGGSASGESAAPGGEREVFRLSEALTVVGRETGDPLLRPGVALGGVPHVSRRQLALVWAPHGSAAGFDVYNLGLNPLHLPSEELPGARVPRGPLRLESVGPEHRGWIAPGMPMRIGEHGPTLHVEELPEQDEDETRFD